MFDRKLQRLVISSALLALSAACTTPLLLVPSSRPLHSRAYKVLGETTAESCLASILGIPISTDASLHTTLSKAKLAIGADALIEITVDKKSLLTGFYNQTCTIVHAIGIKFTDEQAPFVTPGPAIPALPKSITGTAPQTQPSQAKEQKAAKPAPELTPPPKPVPQKPKKLTRAERRRLAREEAKKKRAEKKRKREQARLEKKQEAERKAEQARKKAEEKKLKAEQAKKKAEEKKLKAEQAKKMAQEQKKNKEEAKIKAEESKPVPEEFAIFCKYKPSQPILVETKSDKIEAEFVKCVHFGVRVKQAGGEIGVIPFEKIWSVHMRATEKAAPATPAKPATPRK